MPQYGAPATQPICKSRPEPTRGLHLSTTERSFCLAEVNQLGLQLGPPAAGRTPQVALGSILLGEQVPQLLEDPTVGLDGIEDRVGGVRDRNAFSP
jgi:hypothetical protein